MATVKLVYIYNNNPLMPDGAIDEIDSQVDDMVARIKQIKAYYAGYGLPELLNATWSIDPVKEGEEDKPIRVVFNKQVGTKGSDADLIGQMVAAIEGLPEFVPQVVTLAHELIDLNGHFDPSFIFEQASRIQAALTEADTVTGLVARMEQNLCQLEATLLPHPPLGF